MNTNPNAIRILCYGDSNTRGDYRNESLSLWERYPTNLRWPGILQKLLGEKYEVIEEGLGGRVTNFEDPNQLGKNGNTYLIPCLETNNPINIVILMLGTNDLGWSFNRLPEQASKGIEELIDTTKKYGRDQNRKAPIIVVISPPLINERVLGVKNNFPDGEEKSKKLGELYRKVAKRNNCEFLDAARITESSKKDGHHLDQKGHQELARAIYEEVSSVCN